MRYDQLLVRYGELTLKSGNRHTFVNQLKGNVKHALIPLTGYQVHANRDRMYIHLDEHIDVEEVIAVYRKYLASIRSARSCESIKNWKQSRQLLF